MNVQLNSKVFDILIICLYHYSDNLRVLHKVNLFPTADFSQGKNLLVFIALEVLFNFNLQKANKENQELCLYSKLNRSQQPTIPSICYGHLAPKSWHQLSF